MSSTRALELPSVETSVFQGAVPAEEGESVGVAELPSGGSSALVCDSAVEPLIEPSEEGKLGGIGAPSGGDASSSVLEGAVEPLGRAMSAIRR